MNRIEIIDMLAKHGVTLGDGFAYRTDAMLEQALATWNAKGSPENVHVESHSTEQGGVTFTFTPRGQ